MVEDTMSPTPVIFSKKDRVLRARRLSERLMSSHAVLFVSFAGTQGHYAAARQVGARTALERHEARHGIHQWQGAQGGARARGYRGGANPVHPRPGEICYTKIAGWRIRWV